MLASSYCSRKPSTSNHHSVYITSTPRSVSLKISISNLAGANRFFSLLPLWPLHQCQWTAVSLAVEYPLESGAPLSGEVGGEPPPPTTAHWDLGGHPQMHSPCMSGEPSFGHLFQCRGSPSLLGCTSNQLHWSRTPMHTLLEYWGWGSLPGSSGFGNWRQQQFTTTPPSEVGG